MVYHCLRSRSATPPGCYFAQGYRGQGIVLDPGGSADRAVILLMTGRMLSRHRVTSGGDGTRRFVNKSE